MTTLIQVLASEFSTQKNIIENTLALFSEGATVPFVARYRKEVTGGMDDEQLRNLHSRWQYLEDLNKRREAILESLKQEPSVDPGILYAIKLAQSKTELEDLYAPFKKTRKSKADIAIEAGLLPFAQQVWEKDANLTDAFLKSIQNDLKEKLTVDNIRDGISQILIEKISQNPFLLQAGRDFLFNNGQLESRVLRGKKEQGEKFQDYFEHQEPVKKAAPHRLLALFRGKKEGILKLAIGLPETQFPRALVAPSWISPFNAPCKQVSAKKYEWLNLAWTEKLHPKLETDVISLLKDQAEESAIKVFAENLEDLLMAAPAGAHTTLGLDPGFRNGVKMAVINEQGTVLDHGVIYPHPPQNQSQKSEATLVHLIQKHRVKWVVIGNGTASRETEQLVKTTIKQAQLDCHSVIVSEAGASVYSASKIASQEFPDLDVTIRGAISIARRFQDPLAELVKIDPQAIGVGQYQHDVKGNRLSGSLAQVVEQCVNRVGVDLNLASAPLLTYISGLSERLAQNIVEYRTEIGKYTNRNQLKKVKGIGAKAFEQCAGFLRIREGDEPLDASAVHPESYELVKFVAKGLRVNLKTLIGNELAVQQFQRDAGWSSNTDFTKADILGELAKPGRDPRPSFSYARFDDTVNDIKDLREDMILEGVITNVAAFGAFVDIGVHQDGLIHISQLADRFIKDPRDEVRVGEVVKVQVLECDIKRRRISLKRLSR